MSTEQPTSPSKDPVKVFDKSQEKSTAESPPSDGDKRKKEMIEYLIKHYEISPELANSTKILEDYELVILCDDSGSMNTPIQGTTTTRWDECRQLVNIIVDVYAAFDSNGVDVYFLNRPPMFNVIDTKKLHETFNQLPDGLTPMVATLRAILQAKVMDRSSTQKILVLIVTDGVPTNAEGALDIVSLEEVMQRERTAFTYVTFLACTDEPAALDYLNCWDRSMDNVDVVDDYRSELAQIRDKRGENFKFSFGDYLIKALIGSIKQTVDALDE